MTLIGCKLLEIGLNGYSRFQKDEADGVTWKAVDELLRLFKHGADAPVKFWNVDGRFGGQGAELFCGEAAVADDFGEHLLGRLSWEAPDGG